MKKLFWGILALVSGKAMYHYLAEKEFRIAGLVLIALGVILLCWALWNAVEKLEAWWKKRSSSKSTAATTAAPTTTSTATAVVSAPAATSTVAPVVSAPAPTSTVASTATASPLNKEDEAFINALVKAMVEKRQAEAEAAAAAVAAEAEAEAKAEAAKAKAEEEAIAKRVAAAMAALDGGSEKKEALPPAKKG